MKKRCLSLCAGLVLLAAATMLFLSVNASQRNGNPVNPPDGAHNAQERSRTPEREDLESNPQGMSTPAEQQDSPAVRTENLQTLLEELRLAVLNAHKDAGAQADAVIKEWEPLLASNPALRTRIRSLLDGPIEVDSSTIRALVLLIARVPEADTLQLLLRIAKDQDPWGVASAALQGVVQQITSERFSFKSGTEKSPPQIRVLGSGNDVRGAIEGLSQVAREHGSSSPMAAVLLGRLRGEGETETRIREALRTISTVASRAGGIAVVAYYSRVAGESPDDGLSFLKDIWAQSPEGSSQRDSILACLGQVGDANAAALIALEGMNDPQGSTRAQAVMALLSIRGIDRKTWEETVTRAAGDPDYEVRSNLLMTLDHLGVSDESVGFLLKLARAEDNPALVGDYIAVVGRTGHPDALSWLGELVSSYPNERIRLVAVRELGYVPEERRPRALELIRVALHDEAPNVWKETLGSIVQLGGWDEHRYLKTLLSTDARSEEFKAALANSISKLEKKLQKPNR